MEALGFDNYVEVLKIYLAKYRMVSFTKLLPSPGGTPSGCFHLLSLI